MAYEIASAYISLSASTRQLANDVTGAVNQIANRASSDGEGIGAKLAAGMAKTMKAGAIAAGASVAGVMGVSLKKGFDRLTSIDDARGKLTALGHSADSTAKIMDSAMAAVKGTAYGFGDAATIAASAVAAGVESGEKLQKYLSLTADTASIANVPLSEMGQIFNKVQTGQKAYTMELNQLADRGIPIYQYLQKELGVTQGELKKMVAEGKVSSEQYFSALQKNLGGAATATTTFSSQWANMNSALGRAGAGALEPFFNASIGGLGEITKAIDVVTPKIKDFSQNIYDAMAGTINLVKDGDFTTAFRNAFNVEEDDPIVDRILNIRENLISFKSDLVAAFAGQDVDGPAGKIANILMSLKDTIVSIGPPLVEIGKSFGEAFGSTSVSVFGILLELLNILAPVLRDTLVPAVEKLSRLMQENQGVVNNLVMAYAGFKVASIAVTGLKTAMAAGQVAMATYTAATYGIAGAQTTLIGRFSALIGTINGHAVATNRSKIAAAAHLVVMKAQAVATKAWAVATGAATIAQKVFNAAMNANPLMKIVTVISLIVGALTLFFTKTEFGKKIWDTVWNGIKSAIEGTWNFIKPIFESIVNIFHTVMDVVSDLWTNTIQPVFSQIGNLIKNIFETYIKVYMLAFKTAFTIVGIAIFAVWEIIKAAFNVGAALIGFIWNSMISPIFELIKIGFGIVGDIFSWVWNSVILPVWNAMGTAISFIWNSIITPVFNAIKIGFNALGTFFRFIFDTIIKPVYDAIGTALSFVWNSIIIPVFNAFKAGFGAVGDFLRMIFDNVIKPVWDGLGTAISFLVDSVAKPAFDRFKSLLDTLKNAFSVVVEGIKTVWDKLKEYLKAPIKFAVDTVWNSGVLKIWENASNFLPIAKPPAPIQFRTGGEVNGPGTSTSDSIMARLSKGEHVWDALDVTRAGGQKAVYAIRKMIERGIPFTWDAAGGIAGLPGKALSAIGNAPRQVDGEPADLLGLLHGNVPQFRKGGAVEPKLVTEPAWMTAIARGHEWAKARHGRPYVLGGSADGGGGTDCSGFMSGIADVIQGGTGARQWATMAFNGGGNSQAASGPQGFVAGLAEGFSIGVTNGGAAGGHTAGTLSGAKGLSATNVESGGSPSQVKYGVGAVGADDGYFNTQFHLPIGADGAFESGGAGGMSPEGKSNFLKDKLKELVEKIMSPIHDVISGTVGDPPPEWKNVPHKMLDTLPDKFLDTTFDIVGDLGDMLGATFDKAKEIGSFLVPSFLRDTGGPLPTGTSMVENKTGKPEFVLTYGQFQTVATILETLGRGDLVDALSKSVGIAGQDGAVSTTDQMGQIAAQGIADDVMGFFGAKDTVFTDPMKSPYYKLFDTLTNPKSPVESAVAETITTGTDSEAVGAAVGATTGFTEGINEGVSPTMVATDSQVAAPAAPSYNAGGGVAQWKDVVVELLKNYGQDVGLVDKVLRRMDQESGGNPQAVNNTDINAQNGTPSVGLMQVIGPTYSAYKDAKFDKGPYLHGVATDAYANISASMQYAMKRYGGLATAYDRAGGYNSGGWVQAGMNAFAMGSTGRDRLLASLNQDEFVVNAQGAANNPELLEAINSGARIVSSSNPVIAQGNSGPSGPLVNIENLIAKDEAEAMKAAMREARRASRSNSISGGSR